MRKLLRRRRGQALVETAIILPLAVFMILGIVQLTLMQQARLMTENAAFSAARAGIVFSGDRLRMNQAAFVSVLPAMGIIDPKAPAATLQKLAPLMLLQAAGTAFDQVLRKFDNLLQQFLGISTGMPNLSIVSVTIVNPTPQKFRDFVNSHPKYKDRDEVDFDDTADAIDDESLREINRLTVRARFLYPMRIPFANWIIHTAFMAGMAQAELSGPIWRPTVNGQNANDVIGSRLPNDPVELIFGNKDANLLGLLWQARTVLANTQYQYMIPLNATYTMRMQSNLKLNQL
ncbi:MAG: TadE family protein [Myxococcota bacterium]|jgi:hypothetical protein